MKVKEESEKVGLKLNIQKTKIMASGPIISWEIDGETVSDFILGGSKIIADGDCSHEIKRHLLRRDRYLPPLPLPPVLQPVPCGPRWPCPSHDDPRLPEQPPGLLLRAVEANGVQDPHHEVGGCGEVS